MASRPTPEVKQEIDTVLPVLKAHLSSQPDENDIAAPNERERIWHLRRTITATITGLTSAMEGRLVKLDTRLATAKHWHATLTAVSIDLEKSLAAVEAGGSTDFRLDQALRASLRLIRNGADEDEMFAGPLIAWLHKNGIRPEPGSRSYMSGRGGLLTVETDIAELEKERDQIIAGAEITLAHAKQFVGGMTAPVGQVQAMATT